MNALDFLQAELDYAERQLARVRRIRAKRQADLEATGLDELAVYEQLAATKVHRQLQRDEAFYQQMWLRLSRPLERLSKTKPEPEPEPTFDQAYAGILAAQNLTAQNLTAQKPQPYRKPPTPGPNQKCPCHSGIKYKKCCGHPLRQAA
jgi:hypothetical protein